MRSVASVTSVVTLAASVAMAGTLPPVFPPIDVQLLARPRAFVAGGAAHVVYELHLRSLSSRRLTLERVDVRDRREPDERPPLLILEGAALESALMRPGAPLDDPERRVLTAGRTAILYIWIQAPPHTVPAMLTHRITVHADVAQPANVHDRVPGPPQVGGASIEIRGIDVPVSMTAPPIISAPLAGDMWLAGNGPDNSVGHRRVMMSLAGEGRFPQRFAIDWIRLFPDGRTFHGDPKVNRSYRAYGAEALAVADGTVVETTDGIPENDPDPVARAVSITPQTVGGNFVLLDVGHDAYAFYAHLQPGTLRVKPGDRVRRGQVMGLVGNSGNSTEPHLHFQMGDRPSALDTEGIPYAIASFDLQADPEQVTPALRLVGDSVGIDVSRLDEWTASPAHRRDNEMPMMNALVRFRNR